MTTISLIELNPNPADFPGDSFGLVESSYEVGEEQCLFTTKIDIRCENLRLDYGLWVSDAAPTVDQQFDQWNSIAGICDLPMLTRHVPEYEPISIVPAIFNPTPVPIPVPIPSVIEFPCCTGWNPPPPPPTEAPVVPIGPSGVLLVTALLGLFLKAKMR